MEKYKDKYRIESARANWHDYNSGIYFVTICTKDREYFLGKISDKEMFLSEIGKYVEEQILVISEHYPYAQIPLWVIMPNHLHLIVKIDSDGVKRKESLNCKNKEMQKISNKQGLLSTVICGFKQSVKRFALLNKISFDWQTRFHDHIVRNEIELEYIAEYIRNNVFKWKEDCFCTNP